MRSGTEKFFSIIIPSRNSEPTIGRALESILCQSFQDWEVWVIDGASNDHTVSILSDYSNRCEKISYVSERDSGVYDAMNKGIKLARGEWIYFLGSDDVLHDGKVLRDVFEYIKIADSKVIYGNVKIVGNTSWATNGQVYDGEFSLKKLLEKNICHQSIFYKRSLVLETGYFNISYNLCADWDFNLRCWAKTKFTYINRIIADFYGGGESSRKSSDENFAKDFIPNIIKYFQLSPYHPLLNSGKLGKHPDLAQMQKKLGYFKYFLNKVKQKLTRLQE